MFIIIIYTILSIGESFHHFHFGEHFEPGLRRLLLNFGLLFGLHSGYHRTKVSPARRERTARPRSGIHRRRGCVQAILEKFLRQQSRLAAGLLHSKTFGAHEEPRITDLLHTPPGGYSNRFSGLVAALCSRRPIAPDLREEHVLIMDALHTQDETPVLSQGRQFPTLLFPYCKIWQINLRAARH